jgi:hypothetical protein
MKTKCAWPGCTATADKPFTEGWIFYAEDAALPPNMPDAGYLCPRHAAAYEALAVDEQLPTTTTQ